MFPSMQVNQLLFIVLNFCILLGGEGEVQRHVVPYWAKQGVVWCSSEAMHPVVLALKSFYYALRNSRTEHQESSLSCVFKPCSSITICSMLGFWSFLLLFLLFQLKREMLYCSFFFLFFFLGLHHSGSAYVWRSCCKYTANFYCQTWNQSSLQCRLLLPSVVRTVWKPRR